MNKRAIQELITYPRICFKKGTFIIRQGDTVNFVYYLAKGICSRNALTSKGDEIIYDLRQADGSIHCLLGASSVYLPESIHITNFTAQTNCVCHCLPKNEFIPFLTKNPEIFHELMYLVMEGYASLNENFKAKQEQHAANRLCAFMTKNLVEKDGAFYLDKNCTNTYISKNIGVHRVTVVRIMKALENDGIIRRTGQSTQLLNLDLLLAYARNELFIKY